MQNKYMLPVVSIVFYVAVILAVSLLGAFVYGVATGILHCTDIFQASHFFRTVADALFFVGMIVLTFGAFVEFFVKSRSHAVAKRMFLPYSPMGRMVIRDDPPALRSTIGVNDTGRLEKRYSGGWMLIFIGALIIIFSALFAILSMK
jgi:hypothetical protein